MTDKGEQILSKMNQGKRELVVTSTYDCFIRDTGGKPVAGSTYAEEEYQPLIDGGKLVPSSRYCSTLVIPEHPDAEKRSQC